MNHIVALSGGKDSTAMALRLRELHPQTEYRYVCTPTGNEMPELFAHWERLENLLGVPVIRIGPRYDKQSKVVGYVENPPGDMLVDIIRRQKMVPNFRARFCTRMLKIEPMLFFLADHALAKHYVGLRADEGERKGMYDAVEGVEHVHPMKEWGWGLEDVLNYLDRRGVKVPKRTDCAWCFYQRLAEWKELAIKHPGVYAAAEKIEAEVGHTFRSPGRDTWPAGLVELRLEFEGGRNPQGYSRDKQQSLFDGNCDLEEACRICSM